MPFRSLATGLAALALLAHGPASAQSTYVQGVMNDITTTPEGLLLKLNVPVPGNCANSPYGWMLIRETNKTMIATALMLWSTGQRSVVVYTDAPVQGNFCTINQFDPQ